MIYSSLEVFPRIQTIMKCFVVGVCAVVAMVCALVAMVGIDELTNEPLRRALGGDTNEIKIEIEEARDALLAIGNSMWILSRMPLLVGIRTVSRVFSGVSGG
mgnify:CR=1 FL=1